MTVYHKTPLKKEPHSFKWSSQYLSSTFYESRIELRHTFELDFILVAYRVATNIRAVVCFYD